MALTLRPVPVTSLLPDEALEKSIVSLAAIVLKRQKAGLHGACAATQSNVQVPAGQQRTGLPRAGENAENRSSPWDEFSWTALISQYNKSGQSRKALRMYDEMRDCGVKPSSYTFVAALKACSRLQDLESIQQIHAHAFGCGFASDVFVGTTLVDVYAKCGSLLDARNVFEKMPQRDVVSWNAMILGYAQLEQGEVALQLYTRMQKEGYVPDDRTFVGALKACGSMAGLELVNKVNGELVKERCLKQVRAIHSALVKAGFESDVFVGNVLIDVYAKCGSLVDARNVFDKMKRRNVVSWTAMILGYAHMDKGAIAWQLYDRMQLEGIPPNDRTFVGALKACSSLAASAVGTMDEADVRRRCLERGRAIHLEAVKGGFESDVYVGTMLVDVYSKCGSLVDARNVFEMMPRRNVASWNAMIFGYVQMDEGEVALQLYAQMQDEGVVPDDRTLVGAVKACGIVACLEKGKQIHLQICKVGLQATDSFVTGSLIDMYGKCGSMSEAQQVFDALPSRDIVTWNALIAGYARQGQSELVFDLFQRMSQEGTDPDNITFLSILIACSHGGLLDMGLAYFEAMSRDYGITPTIDHYTCMIDILGRQGRVDEAMGMAKTMPFKPDCVVWNIVLGACQKFGNVDLGRQAFEFAAQLDKKDAAAYVSMSNIYAAASMQEDADEVQTLRVKTRAWKKPGQSWWTDMDGAVHTFVVNDSEHPEREHMYSRLHDLLVKMEEGDSVNPYYVERKLSNSNLDEQYP